MKMKIDSYYEIRVNGWKVAAFAPIRREASEQAFELVASVKDDLYKDKHIQIIAHRGLADDVLGGKSQETIWDSKELGWHAEGTAAHWDKLELAI